MRAMSVPRDEAECAFRLCIGRMTTKEDVETAIDIIIKAAAKISLKV